MDVRRLDWQVYLFRVQQERLQLRLATALSTAKPDTQFELWNTNLDLVIAVARYVLPLFCNFIQNSVFLRPAIHLFHFP